MATGAQLSIGRLSAHDKIRLYPKDALWHFQNALIAGSRYQILPQNALSAEDFGQLITHGQRFLRESLVFSLSWPDRFWAKCKKKIFLIGSLKKAAIRSLDF